ncbi:MAG: T9SS type A sorting domain-containing protein [Cytophagales bacterium]|nr:T9SS type A sorting domain-containing protein [Cytophagales bacterium]
MTQAASGTATTINAPTTQGVYRLFVIDAAGNLSTASTALLTVANQDGVFAASVLRTSGTAVAIASSATASNQVWFAPLGTTVFAAGPTMTQATSGTATTINAPTTQGVYRLFVIDAAGNISTASTAVLTVANQDGVFAASVLRTSGTAVTIVSSGTASNQVWFAPLGTTVFAAGATMTQAASGTATTINAPTTQGVYRLFVIDAAGNISTASTAILTVANQDIVFATNIFKQGGAATSIVSSGTASNQVWFAPFGTTIFAAGASMTKAANGITTTINAPANEGDYRLFVIDAAGNISSASTAILTVDNTPPVVATVVATSGPLKGIGSTRGIVATSVNFDVTFTETYATFSGIDASDFSILKDASLTIGALSISGSGNTRTINVPIVSGTGKISLGVNDDDTILDPAGNRLGGTGVGNGNFSAAYVGTQYYTIAFPEPTNPVAALTTPTITTTSIQVQWNQPGGTQAATHYLVMAKQTASGTYTVNPPVDGTYITDGLLTQNVLIGGPSQVTTFSSLLSGTSYDFIIFPYTLGSNNSDDNIDFKTTTPATVTAVTTVGSAGTLTLVPTPVAVSSIINTSGSAVTVLTYNLRDDGPTPLVDNTPTKFTQLIFNNGNPSLDWTTSLAGVILSDGTNSLTSTAITANTITFASIPSSVGALGYIADDAIKNYTLKVWLKDPITVVDNSILRFVFADTDFTYDNSSNSQISSKLAVQTINSDLNIKIDVIATSLDFVTQPSIFAGVDEDINTSTGYSTGIVHARDKFANLDTDFNYPYVLSAPAGPVRNSATATFTNGVLDLVGMKYNTWGIGTLVTTSNSLTSDNTLSGNSKPCIPINVISVGAIRVSNGQPTSTSLRGGNVNTTIFGVFLKPNHFVSNQPLLKSLTFEFSTPYRTATRTTFKNFKVFEKRADSARVSADNVNAFATLTEIESVPGSGNFDRVKVAFTSDRPLYPVSSSPATVTYFLETDIDVTASNNTPKITPRLVDLGQGDNRIEITQGSAKVSVPGREYSFASTRPPLLVGASCVPPAGTLNVSEGITEIGLTFDVPVVTFDKRAKLYYYNTNQLVATLEATNGIFDSGTAIISTPPVRTMNFKIPTEVVLRPDSVYYVTLAQGKFDPISKTGEGLSDDQLNLYGGIAYKGIYYFKIASNKPPAMVSTDATKYEATPTFASLNASFDQKGKGYYLILPNGVSPVPTATQVKAGTYAGKLSSGTFAIDQLAPNLQYFTATGTFTSAAPYQVWIVAENDAPDLPRPSSGVFGSSPNFTAGTPGPTFTFSQFTPTGTNATPNFQLCPGSFSVVSQPIVLRESNSTGTNATWGTGTQTFNILLPAGFTFDIDYAPKIEQVGADFTIARTGTITASTSSTTVTGSGTSFTTQLAPGHILKNSSGTTIGVVAAIANNTSLTLAVNASVALTNGAYRSEQLPTFKFINSTLLRVTFENAGGSSDDRLIISSMRIAPSSVSSSGEIIRFGGSGLANYIDSERLATIRASALAPQAFTNRYTQFNNFGSSIGLTSVVTSIPDNFLDPDLSNRNVVRLIPKITPSNDYNASFFSGAGVTDDVLSLSGVSKDVAFDITMTRTDLNGCFLSQKEQYLVYDNTKIIPKLTIPVFGPKQAVKNPNYKTPQDVDAPAKGAPSQLPEQTTTLAAKDIAGYTMEQMVLKIPKEIKTFSVVPTRESQIIQDAAWQAQLDRVLVQQGATRTNSNGTIERDYKWDFSHILNAKRVTGGVDKDPYVHFQATSPQGQTYYKGGSLGSVDFIGKFRNDADLLVFQPLVQRIELFVPAIPVIEVVGQFFKKPATASSPDIYVFCERGSDILFNGYPAASPGKSKAFYRLYDDQTDTPLTGSGFTDNANSNGTATLTPSSTAFLNGYKVIRVEYTYQDDNSPAIGTGKFYIQIAPNPIANFKFRSVKLGTKSPNASDTLAICSNNEIIFDASSSKLNGVAITPSSNANFKYTWNFDDSKSSSPKPDSLRLNNPTHTFADVRNYNVTLRMVSDVGCPSIPQAVPQGSIPGPKTIAVKVGDIPDVDFSFLGNCVGDDITFTDLTTTDPATSSSARFVWEFGNGTSKEGFNTANVANTLPTIFVNFPNNPDGKVVTSKYTLPKTYDVKLTTTTNVGCSASKTKTIVQLPLKVATQAGDFSEFFDLNDGGWQALDLTGATPEPGGSIREVSIFNAGAAYTNGIYANRVLTGGTGNGAIADITVAGGIITALDVKVKGTGYKIGDLLTAAIPAGTGLSIQVTKIGISSWMHNDPTAPGKWSTKAYKQNERSALYTACLDLSNIPRPAISFNSFIGLDQGEGLVMQYSKDQKNIFDPTKGWDVLGTTSEDNSPGLFWYNQKALPSNPGTGYTNSRNVSGYGWTGLLGNTVPKHKVEDVTDLANPLPNSRVIFRFALSALNAGGAGIKLDSIRVGSRTRTILFENFTTTDAGGNEALNTPLKSDADFITKFTKDNINSTQLVNINYHVGFVGKDPFNLDNPADPSSRALYYNVSAVPYAFLDGIHSQKNGSDLFKDWGQAAYDLQTLKLASADFTPAGSLTTAVTTNTTDNTLEVEVYVKPTRDLPATTRLHIGILEDVVTRAQLLSKRPTAAITTGETEFNYVLKKLIPDALGTKYPVNTFKRDVLVRLAPGGKVGGTEKFKFTADQLYSNKLTVVVFLQDTTREVYQADLFRNLTPPPPITGFEPIAADQVYVYPNPSDQEFTIELPVNLKSDAAVRLIDQIGRSYDVGLFAAGKNAKTVSTSGLAGGVYIVEIRAEDGALIRKKVMVVH